MRPAFINESLKDLKSVNLLSKLSSTLNNSKSSQSRGPQRQQKNNNSNYWKKPDQDSELDEESQDGKAIYQNSGVQVRALSFANHSASNRNGESQETERGVEIGTSRRAQAFCPTCA